MRDTINTIRGQADLKAKRFSAAQFIRWFLARVSRRLKRMEHNYATRRALRKLTDEQLKDIGISRADAEREAKRPFWDP